jgi:hypothetical protein
MVMLTLIFGLLFGLLSDGAVLFADHRRAEQLADSGARAGASQLDAVALRNAPTQPPRLDPSAAQLKARQYVADHDPEATVETKATSDAIVVRVHLQAATIIAHLPGQAGVDVVAESSAQPLAGLARPEP